MTNDARMSLGAVLLKAWRGERGQTEAARLVETDQSRYSQWERGVRQPSRTSAVKIERGTGGAVPVAAWDMPPPAAAPESPIPPLGQ